MTGMVGELSASCPPPRTHLPTATNTFHQCPSLPSPDFECVGIDPGLAMANILSRGRFDRHGIEVCGPETMSSTVVVAWPNLATPYMLVRHLRPVTAPHPRQSSNAMLRVVGFAAPANRMRAPNVLHAHLARRPSVLPPTLLATLLQDAG